MQPVPDHTRNRSLRFCFRFRFRIWLAVYQFNAHFGARLGFVLCFVFCCSRRRRVAYLARRVRTEDWRLSSSWKLGSVAVADDDDVASAARSARVRFVCRAEGSAFRRSCAFRQRRQNVASPVRSSSFGFVQPRVVFCCSYFAFVFRSSHFAFCFSCFVFSLAFFFRRLVLQLTLFIFSQFLPTFQFWQHWSVHYATYPVILFCTLWSMKIFNKEKVYLLCRRYTYFNRKKKAWQTLQSIICIYICIFLISIAYWGDWARFVYLSGCPYVWLSVCLSICLYVPLSVCLSVFLFVCPYVCLPVSRYVSLSVFLSVCISICPYT